MISCFLRDIPGEIILFKDLILFFVVVCFYEILLGILVVTLLHYSEIIY